MIRTGRAEGWVIAAVIGIAVSGSSGHSQDKPPRTAVESRPITSAEALEFGKKLVAIIERRDVEAYKQAVDANALLEAAAEGVKVPPRLREEFFEGARRGLEGEEPVVLVEFGALLKAGSTIQATRGLEWQGRPASLLRMIVPGGVVSYTLFLLDRRPDGRIRAVDHYPLAAGELFSQMLHRMYQAAVVQADPGVVDRMPGKEQALVRHMNDLKRMSDAKRAGRAEELMAIYDALPEEVKNEKTVQVLRCSAAQNTGDDAKYLEAIQDFTRRFPGDPACDFLLIDGYLLLNQPEKSLECIGRLEELLGEDAYFKVMRGNALTLLNRPEDALAAFHASIAQEKGLRPAYDALLDLALDQTRFGEVAQTLDAMESEFNEEIDDLSETDGFDDFLSSPEGKAWAEKRKQGKTERPSTPCTQRDEMRG